MWLWIVVAVTALLLFVYKKLKKPHQFWKLKGVKYEEPSFIVGNFSIMAKESIYDTVMKIYDKFPGDRYMGVYSFMNPALMVLDPELIKRITIKDFEHFTDHPPFVDPDADPIWANNLFALRGSKWRDMRTTLSPSFTSSKMKILFNLIDECAKNFVHYLDQEPEELNELEMKDLFTRYTNDVIATAAFGLKCDSLKDKNNKFYLMGRELTSFKGLKFLKLMIFFVSPALSRLLRITFVDNKVGTYFSNMIKETVRTREEKHIVRPDMIHLLMEAMKGRMQEENEEQDDFAKQHKDFKKPPITINDIISQALVFFLAGFDTISTLLSFYFYELARNPDIQSKLRQEIIEASKESNGKITYEKLLSLKYLDQTISEALRLWPPVAVTDRIVTKSYTIQPENSNETAVVLDEGVFIWFPVISLQRDPKYYSDPDKFDPERFSDENKSKIDPMTYMPFGIGPRMCIGNRFALLEAKLIIYYLLQNFEIVPIKKTTIPVMLDPNDGNLAPKGGMWLGLKKIQK